jgi:nitrogen fixation protein NifX
MKYKIAIASTDGKVVNEHFGKCLNYLIAELDEDAQTYTIEGYRHVNPPCKSSDHADADFEVILAEIKDCQIVLVSKLGIAAENFLRANGVDPLEYRGFIEDALKRLVKYYKRVKPGNNNIKQAISYN